MKKREFRSDTMTLPGDAMREAMRDAELGDDVVGEDPEVNRLEELSAELLGHEAALLIPSGTFGNQCAIWVHTNPGDEVIVAETAHVVDHEAGAAASLSGVQLRAIEPLRRSWITAGEIERRVRTIPDIHHPQTALIVLENALADGTVMPLEEMRLVRELADEHDIKIHLDGARLFNAAVALGAEPRQIAAPVDSAMFCLSKGLGAPVGSVLTGSREIVDAARRRRKQMGGGMRQAGIIAAPGLIALTEGVARLEDDHRNARLLAERLAELGGIEIDLDRVQTNMVFLRVAAHGKSEQGFVDHMNGAGFAVYPPQWWGIRLAVSSRVDAADCEAFARAAAEYLER
ncbi:MAG: threonine aldolase family protein [Polyangia bacterium]